MSREIITIGVGGAGCRAAHTFWRHILPEHHILPSGERVVNAGKADGFNSFFWETNAGQYVPRALFVDPDPSSLEAIRNDTYAAVFHEEYLVGGDGSEAKSFARGRGAVGTSLVDEINDRISKLVDNCDNVEGFFLFHSVGGGTGAGLGSLILERLAVDYRKKKRFTFSIYPTSTSRRSFVEPINAMCATHTLTELADLTFMFDNDALERLCTEKLEVGNPSDADLNELIGRAAADITVGLRYSTADMNSLLTDLVPFPRLHFITVSSASLRPADASEGAVESQAMTAEAAASSSFLLSLDDYEPSADPCLAMTLVYRGDVDSKTANANVQWLKANGKVNMSDAVDTGMRITFCEIPLTRVDGSNISVARRSMTTMANNTGILRYFDERVLGVYDQLSTSAAGFGYGHWFLEEGMDAPELASARENLGYLVKDYLDVRGEVVVDETDDGAGDDAADDSANVDDDSNEETDF